jgi:hypothetical protein
MRRKSDWKVMRKQDAITCNEKLKVFRVSFMMRNKLNVGIRAHFEKVIHIIQCASNRPDNNDDFGTNFEYVAYLIRKHINYSFDKKDAARKERHAWPKPNYPRSKSCPKNSVKFEKRGWAT